MVHSNEVIRIPKCGSKPFQHLTQLQFGFCKAKLKLGEKKNVNEYSIKKLGKKCSTKIASHLFESGKIKVKLWNLWFFPYSHKFDWKHGKNNFVHKRCDLHIQMNYVEWKKKKIWIKHWFFVVCRKLHLYHQVKVERKMRTRCFHFFRHSHFWIHKMVSNCCCCHWCCVGALDIAWEKKTRMSAGQRKQQYSSFEKRRLSLDEKKKRTHVEEMNFFFPFVPYHCPLVCFFNFNFTKMFSNNEQMKQKIQ